MDLELDLFLIHVLSSTIDIKDGRLVLFAELVLQVVDDQTRLTHSRVADENHLDVLLAVGRGSASRRWSIIGSGSLWLSGRLSRSWLFGLGFSVTHSVIFFLLVYIYK